MTQPHEGRPVHSSNLRGDFMKLTLNLLLTLGLGAVVSPRLTAEEPVAKPRLDRFGDPLPEGAVARMGSGRMRQGSSIRSLSFTPDGKSLVAGGYGQVYLWDAATGKRRRRFLIDPDHFTA